MEINGAELFVLKKIINEAKKNNKKLSKEDLKTLNLLEDKFLNAENEANEKFLEQYQENKKKKNIETIYFHRFKEDNFELFQKYNNDSLRYLGLEVEMNVEIDNTGDSVYIVSIEGQELKEKIAL